MKTSTQILKEMFKKVGEAYQAEQQYKEISRPHVEDYGNEFLDQID